MLSEVPEGWRPAEVSNICEILDRYRVPLNAEERKSRRGSVPYWGANGVVDYIDEALFDEPLLLMPEDGGPFEEADSKAICHRVDGPIWVNNHAHVLRVKDACRDYVFYWFVHRDITPFLVGGTRKKLNQAALRTLPILLPPLPEQKRIAEILSSVDESIQATQCLIDQAERVKRGLMEDLLTGGLGSEAIARGEVPEGWVIDYLGNVARIVTGKTPSTKKPEYWGGSLPFVTPTDLNGSTFVSHTERGLTSLGAKSAKLIPVGSLLFTCIASIGKAAINDKFPCVTNQQINSCVFDQDVETLFMHYQLQHRLNELQEISGKTAVSIISKSKFSQFALLLPPLPEQKRIAEILSSVDEFIQSQKQIIEQYQVTKKGLMDDLLTGKVRTV